MSRTPAEAAAVAAVNSPQTEAGEPGGEPSHPVRLPSGPAPALYVPVRPCPSGFTLRVFRTPLGERTAVAFTSGRLLADCLGPRQAAVRLSLPAVRALAAPLGITGVRIDPQLTAPPVRPPAMDSPAALLPTFPG
ncbi:SAV_915 family protein [Streptomyces orinoci]|uniref:SAV_915 family protein n=1 Tax=Streptomyces orinoci TaxID=67339 RepID=A0ABV3JZJ6_STRON